MQLRVRRIFIIVTMCGIVQMGFRMFAALLLASDLLIGVAHAQTVDSFIVNSSQWDIYAPSINSTIPLADGKVLAGGFSVKFVSTNNQTHADLARLNADGSVDDSFGSISLTPYFSPGLVSIECVALQTNGQMLIAGVFYTVNGQVRYNIARMNTNGTLDTLFDAGYINSGIRSILLQADGKILVGGSFSAVNNKLCKGLCRLNYDGSQDAGFNAGANGSIQALALQPDGKILAGGNFTSIGGQPRTNLARLNADGSLDSSFQPATFGSSGQPISGISGIGGVILPQPDGKILVGGMFDRVNGFIHTNLVRFNSDGTLDTNLNAQADHYNCYGMLTLALQTDGKILVGDDSPTMDGQPCRFLGRLNPDGSLDASFSTNLVSDGPMVFSIALQSDGRILVGGWFTGLGGATRNEIGRLINTGMATQSLNCDGRNILWLRGGTSPEVWRTSFETSTNGVDWSYLGDGLRTINGWQLTNVVVAANATIRARGFINGGGCNGSSWFVESLFPPAPTIAVKDGLLGFRTNHFGFNVSGAANSTMVIDVSSDLSNWTPIVTNTPQSGSFYFNDPNSVNSSQRFYRARSQQ